MSSWANTHEREDVRIVGTAASWSTRCVTKTLADRTRTPYFQEKFLKTLSSENNSSSKCFCSLPVLQNTIISLRKHHLTQTTEFSRTLHILIKISYWEWYFSEVNTLSKSHVKECSLSKFGCEGNVFLAHYAWQTVFATTSVTITTHKSLDNPSYTCSFNHVFFTDYHITQTKVIFTTCLLRFDNESRF